MDLLRTRVLLMGAVVGALAAVAEGHHAFSAEFDANKPVDLRGTVSFVEWVNPHTWIHIDVKNADGTVSNWAIEGGAPNALFRRGFRVDSLAPGTEVLVKGFQAKQGSFRANGTSLTLPDGSKLFVGSPGTGAPEDPGDKPKQ